MLVKLASKTVGASLSFERRLAAALQEIEAEVRTLPRVHTTSRNKAGKRSTHEDKNKNSQGVNTQVSVVGFPSVSSNARGNRRVKGAHEHRKRKV